MAGEMTVTQPFAGATGVTALWLADSPNRHIPRRARLSLWRKRQSTWTSGRTETNKGKCRSGSDTRVVNKLCYGIAPLEPTHSSSQNLRVSREPRLWRTRMPCACSPRFFFLEFVVTRAQEQGSRRETKARAEIIPAFRAGR
jgi:hypothetical protein